MNTIEKRAIGFGLLITAALITFFLIMEAVGLVHNFNLRILNALIMSIGIFLSIYTYQKKKGGEFEYLKGAGNGILTSLVTAITFTIFVTSYVALNPEFYAEIRAEEPQGVYLNLWGISVLIFIEAFASGFLFTYASLQFLKNKSVADFEQKKEVSYKNS